jgi:hypothetical protein
MSRADCYRNSSATQPDDIDWARTAEIAQGTRLRSCRCADAKFAAEVIAPALYVAADRDRTGIIAAGGDRGDAAR